jgi:fibronectin type 3 domain-containing protein
MKKLFFLVLRVLFVTTTAAVIFAAAVIPAVEESSIPDPTILGVNEPETAPPKEAEAGSFIAEEKIPKNLRAAVDGMKVSLSWDKFGDESFYYNVYRAISETGAFTLINKNLLKKNSFIDDPEASLFPARHNTLYFYKVTATDGKNETGDSNMAQAKPMGPLMPPANISIVAREKSIILKWSEPVSSGENAISAYNIFRGADSGGGPQITKTASTALEFEDTADGAGLEQKKKYYYWLQSVDLKGATSPLSVSVAAAPFSGITSPRNVTVSPASSESIKVLWDEPEAQGTYGLLGYRIYRSIDAVNFPVNPVNESIIKPYPDGAGRLFYYDNIINSDKAPEPGVQYYYKVVPVDTEGNTGSSSAPVTGKIEFLKIEKSGILSADISEYGLPPDSKLKSGIWK